MPAVYGSQSFVLVSIHCEVCFAWLHWCPLEAIQAGSISINMKRYHHPGAKIADMIQSKKR
jgi:hypothetical protein